MAGTLFRGDLKMKYCPSADFITPVVAGKGRYMYTITGNIWPRLK